MSHGEGGLFVVPLREGGYAVGVIARAVPAANLILGYFFGPRWERVPTLDEVGELRAEDAVTVLRVSDMGLREGQWQFLGVTPRWERSKWPTPLFGKCHSLLGSWWVVRYDDEDPSRFVSESRADSEVAQRLPADGGFGSGAAEKVLTRLLRENADAERS